ncbi:hypothetical protein BGW80DRAFT_1255106 [Lactifluus volemus]|nr:hypothetical protein BGW80DRAFT_1255106 [Lactifluus volemus]
MVFPAQVFKTPLLPFANNADEAGATASGGPGPGEINTRSSSTSTAPDAAGVSNLFRPVSCRPQDEVGGAQTRRTLAHHQTFFGGGQFSFDSVASSVDDSGYYSSVSEQNDHEGDQIASTKRNNVPTTRPTAGSEMYKRIRPSSPDDDEGVVLTRQNSRSRDISKRPCVRRSPSRSHGTLPRPTMLENASAGGTQTFILPPNIPHPTAAIGDLPGLEFSEADLGRYAELYEQGSERWSKATMEEWLAGGTEIMTKFTEIIDLIKEHMSSKVNLYKSLQSRLADEHSALEQRGNDLRDASQTLVRDSGRIGGGFESNGSDAIGF